MRSRQSVPGMGCRDSLEDTSRPLILCSLNVMGQLHSPCSMPIYVSLSPDERFPATPERVRPTLGPCVQSKSIKTWCPIEWALTSERQDLVDKFSLAPPQMELPRSQWSIWHLRKWLLETSRWFSLMPIAASSAMPLHVSFPLSLSHSLFPRAWCHGIDPELHRFAVKQLETGRVWVIKVKVGSVLELWMSGKHREISTCHWHKVPGHRGGHSLSGQCGPWKAWDSAEQAPHTDHGHICPATQFLYVHKVWLDSHQAHSLCFFYGCFWAKTAELSGFNRDHVVPKA